MPCDDWNKGTSNNHLGKGGEKTLAYEVKMKKKVEEAEAARIAAEEAAKQAEAVRFLTGKPKSATGAPSSNWSVVREAVVTTKSEDGSVKQMALDAFVAKAKKSRLKSIRGFLMGGNPDVQEAQYMSEMSKKLVVIPP